VLTALMLTGRVGSGIAAELGSMVVQNRSDLRRCAPLRDRSDSQGWWCRGCWPGFPDGARPHHHLGLVGILGGWIVAVFQLQIASGVYWSSVTTGAVYAGQSGWGLIQAVRCSGS